MVALAPIERLAPLALEIADRCFVTNYDALYVALAEQIGDLLVTADQRLCDGLVSTEWAGRSQRFRDRAVLRGMNPEA